MLIDCIREVLQKLKEQKLSVDEALAELRALPYQELGFAKLDHHRLLRRGFPEVVLCQGKSLEQIKAIVSELMKRGAPVLATKASPEVFDAILTVAPNARYHEQARMVVIPSQDKPSAISHQPSATILVLSAGTSDIPVAEEAAVTAEAMGVKVERIYDVGVAGIHRLLDHRDKLEKADAIIVVAGMEGALASVVAGLVWQPVIAVPTSVGYGASFQGLAALLSMLNCCAPGVVVVNIDNGFGAGYFAAMIARRSKEQLAIGQDK